MQQTPNSIASISFCIPSNCLLAKDCALSNTIALPSVFRNSWRETIINQALFTQLKTHEFDWMWNNFNAFFKIFFDFVMYAFTLKPCFINFTLCHPVWEVTWTNTRVWKHGHGACVKIFCLWDFYTHSMQLYVARAIIENHKKVWYWICYKNMHGTHVWIGIKIMKY